MEFFGAEHHYSRCRIFAPENFSQTISRSLKIPVYLVAG